MVGCILTGHGTFAEGVGAALEMVGGPQEDFRVVTFLEEEAAEFPAKVAGAISELAEKCGEVVVFCDLMGGTPFNQAMMAGATTPGVRVVTGVNLPMLLECMSVRDEGVSAEELVQTALEIGKMGIAAPVLEDEAADEPEDGEGI